MTRQFDHKEIEREQYIQDHSSTKNLKEEIKELKKENVKLKKKVKKLKKQICKEEYASLTDEQMAHFTE